MTDPLVTWINGFPTSIRVGLFDIAMEITEDPRHSDGDACRGLYLRAEQRILLRQDQTAQRALETVLHELGHVIANSMNIASGDSEERTVAALALGWAQVWRDNPILVKWLPRICALADEVGSTEQKAGPRLAVIEGDQG